MQKKSPLHIIFHYMRKCNTLQVHYYYGYNYPRSDPIYALVVRNSVAKDERFSTIFYTFV